MQHIKLDNIAARQRTYLVFDVLIAALAALILVIQVTVLSGAGVPKASAGDRAAKAIHLVQPSGARNDLSGVLATTESAAALPGT